MAWLQFGQFYELGVLDAKNLIQYALKIREVWRLSCKD